jgi:hypothetical protein
MTLALAALAAFLAGQAGAARPAPATSETKAKAPMTVAVEAAPKGGAALDQWAKELARALEARKDEFRVVKPDEKPELVVRLDSVTPRKNAPSLLALVCRRAGGERAFTYTFTEVEADAEKLARNLRAVADQIQPPAK